VVRTARIGQILSRRSATEICSTEGIGERVNRHCQGRQGVPLGMHRVNPETSNPEPSDPFVTADILLREEPEDEKDEEEHEGGEENDDEDDGYSE
jgi:hypothetical protein